MIRLYVGGMCVSEIAQHLHRSIKTISTHKHSAMEKLGIRSDAELYHYAVQNGLA
ncbi:response regulator transcription factor [Cupriavidus necator]